MTDAPSNVAAARSRRTVPFRDLGVAPENVRCREAADDDVPQLAATIKAAGVLMPLTVRAGRRKEKPFMALDGRRRLLALALLVEAGDIDDGYLVDVVEETDPARQAAAALLTNTALPINVADVVVSIGRMLKSKLTPATVAAALGYGELEVRRFAALAGLHADALDALRQGRITLREARLLARVPDAAVQSEVGRAALAGLGFQTWRVTGALEDGRITTLDRRFALVGMERYTAAGGRTESDLFGELPDALLDAPVLEALWRERVEAVAAAIPAEGLSVYVAADWRGFDVGADLEPLGYVYLNGLPAEDQAAYQIARQAHDAIAERVVETELAGDDALLLLQSLVRARLAADRAGHPGRIVRAIVLSPATRTGLEIRSYAEPLVAGTEDETGDPGDCSSPGGGSPSGASDVPAPTVVVDLEGVGHALHETRTDVATRGLIRALADDPGTALAALVARLFTSLVLETARSVDDAALAIVANGYVRPGQDPIETLDGEVRARLAVRRDAYRASGMRPIPWVAGLPHGERMALLAELVAVTLNLREARTSALRVRARADAGDIAGLASADITDHWTPDEPFLQAHAKPQLLAMLDAMGAADERARLLKKTELVGLVAERAAERGWAPQALEFRTAPLADAAPDEGDPEAAIEASVAEDTSGAGDGQPFAARPVPFGAEASPPGVTGQRPLASVELAEAA